MFVRVIAILGVAALLGGCAASVVTVSPVQTIDEGESSVTERNYTIGQPKSAYVGDSMVRLKNYIVNETHLPMMSTDKNFVHSGSGAKGMTMKVEFHGVAGEEYPIVGEAEVDGRSVYILDGVPGSSTDPSATTLGVGCRICLMVDKATGLASSKVIYSRKYVLPATLTTTPSDTVFRSVKKSLVSEREDAPYVNQEIVYGGVSNNTIRLMYREYTRNDLARAAFFQDLSYDVGSKILRFRNIRMSVQRADNEEIVFTVLEDGVPEK